MVLDIEIGKIVFVAMVVASLAALSAFSKDPLDEDEGRYGVDGTMN